MFMEKDATVDFNCELANRYGMQMAVVYNAVGCLERDGDEVTVEAVMDALPFLKVNQVRHSLRTLEKCGAIVSEQPEMSHFSTRKRYKLGEAF